MTMKNNSKRYWAAGVLAALLVIIVILSLTSLEQEKGIGGGLVISEVCAKNFASLDDGFGEYPEWVEIYNSGDSPVSLTGYSLRSSRNRKWFFDDVSLQPGQYMLVAYDKESYFKGDNLDLEKDGEGLDILKLLGEGSNAYKKLKNYFSFHISGGDRLCLCRGGTGIVDAVDIPELPYDVSYARNMEEAGRWETREPTPGYDNSEGRQVPLPSLEAPAFSAESGFYEDEFELELNAGEGAEIYYTLDSEEPLYNGIKYTGPIRISDASANEDRFANREDITTSYEYNIKNIFTVPQEPVDKATVVKAVAIDGDGNVSETVEKVYFVGFEDKEGYEGVPVISITSEPDRFFDETDGIYVKGKDFLSYMDSNESKLPEDWEYFGANYKGRGRQYEVKSNLTYFDEEHEYVYSQVVGVRLRGRNSRAYPQKGFKIFAREEYDGNTEFKEAFFEDNGRENSISLFTGGQDYLYKYHDVIFSRLLKGSGVATVDYRPAFVFFEGEFWGLYWIQERYDDKYFLDNYGIARGNAVVVKMDSWLRDSDRLLSGYSALEDFVKTHDFYKEATYEEFCRITDIDSLMVYYAANIYNAHGNDWPRSNVGLFRSARVGLSQYADTRWRYLIHDNNSSSFYAIDGDTITGVMNEDPLFANLMKSEHFRRDFYKKFVELEDEVLTPERALPIIDGIHEEFGVHLSSTWERFFAGSADAERLKKYEDYLKQFFKERRSYIEPLVRAQVENPQIPEWFQ